MYRICYIDNWQRDHQKALFHKWIDNEIVKKDGTRVMQTLALVEFEDGTMYRAEYSTVRFEDTDLEFNCLDNIPTSLEVENQVNGYETAAISVSNYVRPFRRLIICDCNTGRELATYINEDLIGDGKEEGE